MGVLGSVFDGPQGDVGLVDVVLNLLVLLREWRQLFFFERVDPGLDYVH